MTDPKDTSSTEATTGEELSGEALTMVSGGAGGQSFANINMTINDPRVAKDMR
jgi:hypothetical protein